MTTSRELVTRKGSVAVSRGDNPIRGLQGEVNRLFNDFFGDFSFPVLDHLPAALFTPTPAIDVAETDTGYVVTAELPGIEAKDIEISVSDGYVTLQGERSHHKTTDNKNFVRQERSYGAFKRVLPLPKDADLDQAQAEMRNGVLTLTIARTPESAGERHKIKIREVA